MPLFYIQRENHEKKVRISGEDYIHLVRVRRLREGDSLLVRDQQGGLWQARAGKVGKESIELLLEGPGREQYTEKKMELGLALLKGKSMDLALQKATETGVTRIRPFYSLRTVVDPDRLSSQKPERWKRIVLEASKQSMRREVPVVEEPVPLDELLEREGRRCVMAHPGGFPVPDRGLDLAAPPLVLVGPEGGFSPEELDRAAEAGCRILRFDLPVLRSETAAALLPVLLRYLYYSHT